MAKPSEQDIDAAGDLMCILNDIDKGYYPERGAKENAPTWFDEDNPEHLRAFYDAVKATLDKGPGYPVRVIGGMCYVVMWDKNEIVDPESDTIDLHPKIVKALEAAEAAPEAPVCTCPSGDGSLHWPCPRHPSEPPASEQAQQDAVKIVASQNVPQAWREFARAIRDLPVGAEPNVDGMRAKARQLLANEERRAQEGGST